MWPPWRGTLGEEILIYRGRFWRSQPRVPTPEHPWKLLLLLTLASACLSRLISWLFPPLSPRCEHFAPPSQTPRPTSRLSAPDHRLEGRNTLPVCPCAPCPSADPLHTLHVSVKPLLCEASFPPRALSPPVATASSGTFLFFLHIWPCQRVQRCQLSVPKVSPARGRGEAEIQFAICWPSPWGSPLLSLEGGALCDSEAQWGGKGWGAGSPAAHAAGQGGHSVRVPCRKE